MKKAILALVFLFTTSIMFTSCKDEKKTSEEKVEAAIEEIQMDAEEAGEEMSDDVEDAIEDVQDEIEEAKEEAEKH